MTEISTELVSRLVVRRKRDGRCAYDPHAKAEVIQACLQPGVSMARIGLQCGINANLLRRWVSEHQAASLAKPTASGPPALEAMPAFVALQLPAPQPLPPAIASSSAVMVRLQVRLPNGVAFELSDAPVDALQPIVRALGSLVCSSSTSR